MFPNSVTYRHCCNQCLAMAAGTLLICVRAKREIASRCYHLHRFNQRSREKGAEKTKKKTKKNKTKKWQQAAFVTAFTGQLVKFHLKNDGHLSAFVPLSLVACAGPTMHSANDQIRSLCLCAIVPLCLAPDKTKIAKQVPARCGHLVELHVKSRRHSSAFVLLYLCAFRQRNSKDFKVSPALRSANDAVKSLCLCAIVRLCLAPNKTMFTKEVPACCLQLVELLLKSDRHSSAFVPLCLCALRQKKVRISR